MSEWFHKEFEVLPDHIALLRHSYTSCNSTENGAASSDPKYPYGDYMLETSMAKIIGMIPANVEDYEGRNECTSVDYDEDDFSLEQIEYLHKLHADMETVLEILLRNCSLDPGIYETKLHSADWVKKIEEPTIDDLIKPEAHIYVSRYDLQAKFYRLAAEACRDTSFYSNLTYFNEHPAVQEIIAMGTAVVPIILHSMKLDEDWWFQTLEKITGEEIPYDPSHAGRLDLLTQDALDWGREKGYID